jgi:hypothetical protein
MSEENTSVDEGTGDVEMSAAAVSDGAYTLIVADFSDTDSAWAAYEALRSVEDGRTVEVEGVIVVKRSTDGKLEIQKATDHSTRSGLRWGVVGGIALGVVFPPPPRRARAGARERDSAGSLRPAGAGVRPGRREGPGGARPRRRHRRVRHRQGRGSRHQGGRQGGTGVRRRLTAAARRDASASRHGASTNQVALAWLLAISPITLPIPGTATAAHLEDNLAAAMLHLDQDEMDAITGAAAA